MLKELTFQCNRVTDVPRLVLLQAEAVADDEDGDVMKEVKQLSCTVQGTVT